MSRSAFSFSPRTGLIVGAIVVVFLWLSWMVIPDASSSNGGGLSGSTYGRSPDGYGAWYAYMEDLGAPVTRWQQPFDPLVSNTKTVLVRVEPRTNYNSPSPAEQAWLEQGNRLVLVGARGRVTTAAFSKSIDSAYGAIALDTRRRRVNLPYGAVEIFSDDEGAIAWRQIYGAGDLIVIVPPFIAANAYQDAPGNFAFLADFVNKEGYARFVDEYIHGYRDMKDIVEEVAGSWWTYLTQTPFLPALVQLSVLLIVLFVVNNRRYRLPIRLKEPETNNSRAYIEALASVLQKAERPSFVIEMVGREEQRQIQQALGLGAEPVDPELLLQMWQQRTGHSTVALNQVMQPYWHPGSMNETQLMRWIEAVQRVHHQMHEAFGASSQGAFSQEKSGETVAHSHSPTQNLRQVATGESSR